MVGGSQKINGLSGTGIIDMDVRPDNFTLTVGLNNQTSTFDGTIRNTSGILGLTKQGTGTLTLTGTGNNTYTGVTNVAQGTLIPASATALGSTDRGTTVDQRSDAATAGRIDVRRAPDAERAGVSGSGALYSASGTNTWSGTIDLATSSTIAATGGSNLTISGEIRRTTGGSAKR